MFGGLGIDKIGNFLANLGSSGMNFGSWEGKILFWLKVFTYLVFAVFGAILFWKLYLQYNKKVIVYIKSGGGVIDVRYDRARAFVDDQGKYKLVLWKMRRGKYPYSCAVPESKYKLKAGKTDLYQLMLDDNSRLHPIDIGWKKRLKALYNKKQKESNKIIDDANTDLMEDISSSSIQMVNINDSMYETMPELRMIPQEQKAWARLEDQIVEKKYLIKNKWKEFIPAAVMTAAFLISFLILFFMFKEMGNGMGQLANSFAEVSRTCLS